ncbi:hypothetical protein [Achromobacter piechaudii]|uniref:Uncharacterized protein n=1 Tax=Achromobacter piechaudii TaxID=72556 RepID=A0ABM8L2U3_9BURK|nr:hypothetical protein [Achromobacter piechaudii]CAB3729110.1 hypothetical protein LMG1873_04644 [Achromobacter piechaudii]
MGAIQSFERFPDDQYRVGAPYTLPGDPPDEDMPRVTEMQAVSTVLACLYNETAGAYGQSAAIWAACCLDQLGKLQIGTCITLLDGETVPSAGKGIRTLLREYIHAEANRLIQEMDPDELESYL